MTLQAYIDESFDNNTYVMAGFIATEGIWKQFKNDWEEILPSAPLDRNGNRAFKMKEMAKTSDRIKRVADFAKIIERYGDEIIGVSVAFKIKDHQNALKRIWALNGLLDFGSYKNPYMLAVAFRTIAWLFDEELRV